MADKQAADAAAKLVEEAPFDASSLPSFVRYLDVQIQQGTYDAESNRCILKIFQLHPSQVQLDVVVKVLVKALSNLPLNDFVDFYAVLSEQVKSSPQVSSLHQLHRALDGCQFDSFWQLAVAEPAKTLLATVPGVHTALRKFIASVLAISYRNVSVAGLQSMLSLASAADVDAFVASLGWKRVVLGGVASVELPAVDENQSKAKTAFEALSLGRVAALHPNVFAN